MSTKKQLVQALYRTLHSALQIFWTALLFSPRVVCCRFRDIHSCTDNPGELLSRNSHFKMPRLFLQSQAIHCGNVTLIESYQPLHLKSWNPCATTRSGILRRKETWLLNWAAEAKHQAARWWEGTQVFRWCLEGNHWQKPMRLSVTGLLFLSRKTRETYSWRICNPWKIIPSERKKKNHIRKSQEKPGDSSAAMHYSLAKGEKQVAWWMFHYWAQCARNEMFYHIWCLMCIKLSHRRCEKWAKPEW